MATVIDTLEIVRELKAGKLGDEQAEAVARAIVKGRAADLSQLVTKSELHAAIDKLEAKMAEAKFDLLKWIVPLLTAQIPAIAGLYLR